MIYNILKFILLIFWSFNLFTYDAKVIFIDNNFKDLKNNKINKVIYLSSDISFDIEKGKVFNLYRNINKTLNKKMNDYIDLNKKLSQNKIKKICVIQLKVISVIDNLIKAIEYKKCKERKKEDEQILGEFQYSKIDDFIEIKTIFDKKDKKTVNVTGFSDIIASMFMIGIDDDYNYLLESGIKKVNKSSESKLGKKETLERPKGEKYKKLPKKQKKKSNKGKNQKYDFDKIRL